MRNRTARAHYIVRVGNEGVATTVSTRSLNHWHYLSPQRLWGLPKSMTHVKVRAELEANMEKAQVTVYVWFLCNGYGGPGHFVQVGIATRRVRQGPVENGTLPIPAETMTRLRQGFNHWFEWRPVTSDVAFLDRVRQLPAPKPTFIPTLRRVTADHPSFPLFQGLIDNIGVQQAAAAATTTIPATLARELENIRRERAEPHSPGYLYLIHMGSTTFYKIGMSLDPEIRLHTLQTGNPQPLHLLTTQAVQDMRSAEMGLHRQFESQRVPNPNVREWFDLGDRTDEVQKAFVTVR